MKEEKKEEVMRTTKKSKKKKENIQNIKNTLKFQVVCASVCDSVC